MRRVIPPMTNWPPPPDRRFGMARAEPGEPWSLSLWILDLTDGPLCAYGWAIPRPVLRSVTWTQYTGPRIGPFQFWRLTCLTDYEAVNAVLRELFKGSSLQEAASFADRALPEHFPSGALRLATDEPVTAKYAAVPWTFRPRPGVRSEPAFSRSRPSPNPEAPAVGTSLILRDKQALADLVDMGSVGALDALLLALESETGFAFTKDDAERLGDIEMFLFPAAFADERPRVRVRFDPHPSMEIELPENTPLVVRCVQENGGLILADETKVLSAASKLTRVEFAPTPDGPHGTTVQIWTGENRALWFDEQVFPIRRIGLQAHFMGSTVELQSDWLTQWAKNGRRREAAARMKKIARPSIAQVSTVGEPDADFISAARDARQWASSIHHARSGAQFFPQGEKLKFATWLRDELASARGVSAVVLFDPYIDRWGLELFARVENATCIFEIVTTLRRKRDSSESEEETRKRLTDALAALRIVLEGLRLRVQAFGGERPFHDRVVLAYDDEQRVIRGYQLSNSLDGAAKNYPLLVTPIPEDVLRVVADDFARVMRDDHAKTTLHDSLAKPVRSPLSRQAAVATESVDVALDALVSSSAVDVMARWVSLTASMVAAEPQRDPYGVLASVASRAPVVSTALKEWLSDAALTAPLPVGVGDVPVTRDGLAILTLYGWDFASASRQAVHFVEHFHEYAGAPWTVDYALQFLVHNAPKSFVSVLDALTPIASAAAAGSGQAGPVGAILVTATSHVTAPLILAPTDELRTACLYARTPFVRALAAAGVGETLQMLPVNSRLPPKRALALVEVLILDERLLAVSEWIGGLRVRANRQRREESADRELRQILMRRLFEWWNTGVGDKLAAEVVRRTEGPIPGGWAADTTNDLLLPLVEAKKIQANVVRRISA